MQLRLILTLLLISLYLSGLSQIDYDKYPRVSDTYLINDVIIQKNPSDSFGLGDILIKKGFIEKVAKEITAPPEAFILEGDSMFVYPAFIDALSHVGIPKAESSGEKKKVKFRGYPPNALVGITPELLTADLLDPTDASFAKARSNGFALAHVVPRGKILPGQGSLVLLKQAPTEDLLLKDKTSMFFQLKGTRGYYPSTVIGVMAKWKELFRQTKFYSQHQTLASSGQTRERAKNNKVLSALIPLTQKQQRLFMRAVKSKDIYRAFALQKELGYDLVLSEVREGFKVIEKIKEMNVPILISTKLPKELKEKTKKADKEKNIKEGKDSLEESEELQKLKKRQKESYTNYLAQAAVFEQAEIPFAFSFLDANHADFKKALLKMIDAGLTIQGALEALTTNPARILGLSEKVGEIKSGMMANLFLSDKPYFEKKSHIKYIFVEGEMTELELEKKKISPESKKTFLKSLKGRWGYEFETPNGKYSGLFVISGSDELRVNVTASDKPDLVLSTREISLEGQTLTFAFTKNIDNGPTNIEVNIEIDGEEFDGQVNTEGSKSFPIVGSKISSPENQND